MVLVSSPCRSGRGVRKIMDPIGALVVDECHAVHLPALFGMGAFAPEVFCVLDPGHKMGPVTS